VAASSCAHTPPHGRTTSCAAYALYVLPHQWPSKKVASLGLRGCAILCNKHSGIKCAFSRGYNTPVGGFRVLPARGNTLCFTSAVRYALAVVMMHNEMAILMHLIPNNVSLSRARARSLSLSRTLHHLSTSHCTPPAPSNGTTGGHGFKERRLHVRLRMEARISCSRSSSNIACSRASAVILLEVYSM
jgi:hypothetical protein